MLLARRWVTEEKLYTAAPWLRQQPIDTSSAPIPAPEIKTTAAAQTAAADEAAKAQTASQPTDDGKSGTGEFDENLRKYRELISEILGEAN